MEKIAQGGMAEIYKGLAYDVHGINQKAVCIKKILSHLSADKEFIGSIIDEAKLAVKLVHGNIAQTYDLGKVGDDYYMVMEYVDGATLSQINKRCLKDGKLIPVPVLAYFISEVAQGLDYMHRRTDEDGRPLHIVHRDISPQNIMVSYSGTVKIIDFGIAKAAFKAGPTESGILKGKFAYMSPEQAYGDAIDHRSDIYSLGIIMHEMLTGKRLFKATESRQTIRNVRRAQVEPPSSLREDLTEGMDRIVMKALSKDRRHRYPYASEFRDDLIKYLHKHHPDFKPFDAAAFVQELFKQEIAEQHPLEADSKTPALIIDRTNSALAEDEQFEVTGAAKAPVDLDEFMIDEESLPRDEEDAAYREGYPEIEEPPELEEFSVTRSEAKRQARRTLLAGMGIALMALIAIGAFVWWRHRAPAPTPTGDLSEIMVVTEPADALVLIDGRQAGRGSPVSIKNVEPGVEHAIRITKDGYLTHDRRVELARGEFLSIDVDLKPAAPPTADVEIISSPPGATVYIDDRETKYRTPATIEGLDVNRQHTIGLYLTGYKFWTKEAALKGGQIKSFEVTLNKDYGSVLVESDPEGAIVIIDGTPAGQTPLKRDDLDPEKVYQLEIWHEGYETVKRELTPVPGKQQDVRVTLERSKPEPGKTPPGEALQ